MIPFQETNLQERRLYELAARQGIPLNGSFELTPLCTMDCSMCFVRLSREELAARGKLLTPEQWLALAEELKAAGTLFLLLTGGEPLLYPGFRELYLRLRGMGFILMLNTNATLIDESWADFFAKNPPRRINVTLYGANAKDYAAVCRNPDGFEKAERGIRMLKERGVPVKLSGSLVKANVGNLNAYLALCEELGLPVMTETYMMPACRERSRPFDLLQRVSPHEYAEAKMRLLPSVQAEELLGSDIRKILTEVERNRETNAEPFGFGCKAGTCSFAINWQGHMRPCVLLSEPEVDVLAKGFLPAWDEIRSVCAGIRRDSKCLSCAYRSLCPNCPAAEKAENGCFGKAPEYLCESISRFVELLQEYAAVHATEENQHKKE